ncbi:hypothetical protein [Chelativorans sp. AA-79]|uniref:hypothetical protein n=1 Tax=Chelativorans sp. AA-79 TaxID=3028735 RepID=UPI0023F8A2BB|nr:hypothetical protein [Chelativorans sp. AA-79]WEX08511.1 hypothetical protein PVE73_20925 [Chelativorans sp. AA-79]
MNFVVLRRDSCIVVLTTVRCGTAGATTEAWQDKKPHIAALTVGWFCWLRRGFAHIARTQRDVRCLILLSAFSTNRTSQVFAP